MEIEIISRPLGEAPEWVRDHWIGVTLPLANATAQNPIGFGVLTGPKALISELGRVLSGKAQRHEGYIVDAKVAVKILEARSPEAATWWRENTPHLFRRGRRFVFDLGCCRPVVTPARRKP